MLLFNVIRRSARLIRTTLAISGAGILCILLSACSTGTVSPGNQYSYQSIPAMPPRITFVRNQNKGYNSVITSIAINDWVIGTLAAGEHLSINHEPGLHYVSVKGTTVPLTFRNGREYYVLIEQDLDGSTKSIRSIYPKEAAHYMQSDTLQTAR